MCSNALPFVALRHNLFSTPLREKVHYKIVFCLKGEPTPQGGALRKLRPQPSPGLPVSPHLQSPVQPDPYSNHHSPQERESPHRI